MPEFNEPPTAAEDVPAGSYVEPPPRFEGPGGIGQGDMHIAPGGSSHGVMGPARWQQLMKGAPTSFSIDPRRFDQWLLTVPEDSRDIWYTAKLREEKARAAQRQRDGSKYAEMDEEAKRGDPVGVLRRPLPHEKDPKAGHDEGQWISRPEGPAGEIKPSDDGRGQFISKPTLSKRERYLRDNGLRGGKDPDRKTREIEERQHREATGAIILGLPVTDADVLTGVDTSATASTDGNTEGELHAPDNPYLDEWLRGEGLDLSGRQTAVAMRNGNWVYIGTVDDPAGGKGHTRPVYQHVKEAVAGLAAMDPEKIKEYQRALEMPETGLIDEKLQAVWEQAIGTAQFYAQKGRRVELQYLFDVLIQSKVAQRNAGGGGGGKYAEETPQDMASYYYAAMQAILGDTSGVASAASGH